MNASHGFTDFYESTFPVVYRAAFAMCRDGHVAEEAAQEAFARALARWNRLGNEPWAGGWVMRTALNLVRRGRRSRVRAEVQRSPNGERDVDLSLDLWRAIGYLPRRQQEAVLLHYVSDLPIKLVARAMGCREGTVKAQLWKARQHLSQHLEVDDYA